MSVKPTMKLKNMIRSMGQDIVKIPFQRLPSESAGVGPILDFRVTGFMEPDPI
jgi:hypothetical protein